MPMFTNVTGNREPAIVGVADNGIGVHGTSGIGVHGVSKSDVGVRGFSETGEGMRGDTQSPTMAMAAIAGFKQQSSQRRDPISLLGKVYCKGDAQHGIGDLLTTPTPGHAMRVDDPLKALGTIIGKSLGPFREGQELVPQF